MTTYVHPKPDARVLYQYACDGVIQEPGWEEISEVTMHGTWVQDLRKRATSAITN